MPIRRASAFVFLALAAVHAGAQSNAVEMREPEVPAPSRFAQDQELLDQVLRQRLLTATEARDLWMAGQLDRTDPWSQASALARARTLAPSEMIYVASLAAACLPPVRPLPPECDTVDRLADWAIRDGDNGVPSLLLADRARLRNNATAMVAFLEEAATRPRFEDYQNRGALFVWAAVKDLPGTVDPAARALLAATQNSRGSYVASRLDSLCRDAAKLADTIRSACYAAGTALAQRGSNWQLRLAGARLAERSAAPAEQNAARQRVNDVSRRAFECAEAGNAIAEALESQHAAIRARALAAWEARLVREAQAGDVAVCGGKPG